MASGSEMLLAKRKNLVVLDNRTALFFSAGICHWGHDALCFVPYHSLSIYIVRNVV